MRRIAIWYFVLLGVAWSQTLVDVQRQSKGTDYLLPPFSSPVRIGDALPLTCEPGELYFLTNAPAGGNLHVCHQTGAWTPQGSSGEAQVTVQGGGVFVGTRSAINLVAGAGIMSILGDTGSRIDIQQQMDSAIVLTRSAYQSGESLACISASANASQYYCSMNPTLSALSAGMVIYWRPDVANASGGITLDIDSLGARAVKMADGVSDPEAGTLLLGGLYALWYDGSSFRLAAAPPPGNLATDAAVQSGGMLFCESFGGQSASYTCGMNPVLTHLFPGLVVHWRPDVSNGAGGITIEIDNLGPRDIVMPDGTADPDVGALAGGALYPIWYDGTKFRLVAAPLPANLVSQSEVQGGANLVCLSQGAQSTAYQCDTTPAINALSTGTMVNWIPDVENVSGGITLDVNGLGAKAVKMGNGTTDPPGGVFRASEAQPLWYDGLNFRRLQREGILSGPERPACASAIRGWLWLVPGDAGTKDEIAVCAKDGADAFDWRMVY